MIPETWNEGRGNLHERPTSKFVQMVCYAKILLRVKITLKTQLATCDNPESWFQIKMLRASSRNPLTMNVEGCAEAVEKTLSLFERLFAFQDDDPIKLHEYFETVVRQEVDELTDELESRSRAAAMQ